MPPGLFSAMGLSFEAYMQAAGGPAHKSCSCNLQRVRTFIVMEPAAKKCYMHPALRTQERGLTKGAKCQLENQNSLELTTRTRERRILDSKKASQRSKPMFDNHSQCHRKTNQKCPEIGEYSALLGARTNTHMPAQNPKPPPRLPKRLNMKPKAAQPRTP